MAFNRHDKNFLKNLNAHKAMRFPQRHLEWTHGKRNESGFTPIIYNYDALFQKEFLDAFFNRMSELGFSQKNAMLIAHRRIGLRPSEFWRIQNGLLSLKAWQIGLLAEIADLQVKIYKKKENYSYRSEGYAQNLLVLQSHTPRFTVTFNKEDLLDFSVDFGEDNLIIHCQNVYIKPSYYFAYVWKICQWFFMDMQKRTKMPFSKTLLRHLFDEKWKRNETKHLKNNIRKPIHEKLSDDDLEDFEPEDDQEFIDANFVGGYEEMFHKVYKKFIEEHEEIVPEEDNEE